MSIQQWAEKVSSEIEKAFVGKPMVIEKILVAILAGGHILLEDIPGVGKTILARATASALGGRFSRIQGTPDLLPADILGVSIYQPEDKTFRYRKGPILNNVVLVDEINRATPRTQSALLEAMGEFQISVEGSTIDLPRPFILLATENPIDFEGTFPLPEAQRDRFLMSLGIGYPGKPEEQQIIQSQRKADHPVQSVQAISSPDEVENYKEQIHSIHMAQEIMNYLLDLVEASRRHSLLSSGVSPRGSISLSRSAQALAAIRGRSFVIPDDIQELFVPVCYQRVILNGEGRIKGISTKSILDEILELTPVPTGDS